MGEKSREGAGSREVHPPAMCRASFTPAHRSGGAVPPPVTQGDENPLPQDWRGRGSTPSPPQLRGSVPQAP